MLSYFISTDTIPLKTEEVKEQMDIPLTNGVIHYTSKRENSINEQALLSEGYTPTLMTDGSSIYCLNTGAKEAYLDSRSLMHYILEWQGGAQARTGSAGRLQSSSSLNSMTVSSIFSDEERAKFSNIFLQLRNLEENSSSQTPYALAQVFLGQGRTLSRELYMSANNLYTDGFQQEFDVEPRITAIVTDTLLYMAEGAERTVTVSILPAEAARGKQLKAVSLDESVVTVSPSLGEGLGWVLTAKTLGSSAVRFCLTDDDELTATTTVHVRDAASMYVYTPRASRMSGTEVSRGAEIKLTSQTAGATILYTLDGSCPCDGGPSVLTYRGPITATGDELHIKAMAVANGMAESEVAEFRYKVIDNPVGIKPIDISQSEIVNFRTYYRLDGRRTAKPQKGLNIVRQGDGTVQKILVK